VSDNPTAVEHKVQAALSHQLKRSAGAVRSHLKKIRKKLTDAGFASISSEYERVLQEVEFQVALAHKSSIWSAQPELHIEDVPGLLDESSDPSVFFDARG